MLDTQANVPATISVVFPRADSGVLGTDVYAVDVTLASLALTDYGDEVGRTGSHLIHVAAIANYTGGGSPANVTQLTTLATQIATDWYLWRLASVVAKYRGIAEWTCDGMHDIEYIHADAVVTSITVSRWEPDFSDVKICGTYGSADVPVTGSGTVTSVALALPSIFTVSGSPVTTTGTLTGTLATQSANLVFAGPSSGGAATPTFRSLVAGDIPALGYVTSVNGQTGAVTCVVDEADGTVEVSTTVGVSSTTYGLSARVATYLVSGIVSTTTQSFSGDKTFNDDVDVIGDFGVGPTGNTGYRPFEVWYGALFNEEVVFGGGTTYPSCDVALSVIKGHSINSAPLPSSLIKVSPGVTTLGTTYNGSLYFQVTDTAIKFLTSIICQGSTVSGGMPFLGFPCVVDLAAITISAWSSGFGTYYANTSIVSNSGSNYRCIRDHASSAGKEPGVSSGWEVYWDLLGSSVSPIWTAWGTELLVRTGAGGGSLTTIAPVVRLTDNGGNDVVGFTGPVLGLEFCSGWLVSGTPSVAESDLASQAVAPAKLKDADFGDFSVSSGVATIEADAVTNAKLANAAAYSFKANLTSGSANPTDVTLADLTAEAAPASGDYFIAMLADGSFAKVDYDDLPGGGAGDVTAASTFGTDNRLIRSDGTTKGVQASGITIDDSDNVTGVATLNKVTITAPATGSTLTIVDGKTLTVSNTITITATDGSTLAIGTGGTLGTAAYTASSAYDAAGAAAAAQAASQPLDATLTALAGANWAANSLAIGSGSDTVAQVAFSANTFPARASTGNLVAKTITDFALTILDDADGPAVRATIGAGTGGGSVTSVDVSGGSTGLSTSGGPVTSSGTITLAGTLVVANGGTGVVSTTAYAVLCGGTTSTGALQSVASVGTAGQVLTSNGAGALPTFQTVSGGSGWCNCTVSGGVNTLEASFGITSVARNSVGNFTINFAAFTSAETFTWCGSAVGDELQEISRTSSSLTVQTISGADPTRWGVMIAPSAGGSSTLAKSNLGIYSGSFYATGAATTSFAVVIGATLGSATYQVLVTPTNSLSAALLYVSGKTTTGFNVVYLAGLTGTVAFDWMVIGGDVPAIGCETYYWLGIPMLRVGPMEWNDATVDSVLTTDGSGNWTLLDVADDLHYTTTGWDGSGTETFTQTEDPMVTTDVVC